MTGTNHSQIFKDQNNYVRKKERQKEIKNVLLCVCRLSRCMLVCVWVRLMSYRLYKRSSVFSQPRRQEGRRKRERGQRRERERGGGEER